MFWFRKFLAIVSVSLGVALVVLPFPAQLSGERTVEVVHLEAAPAPYDEAAARARFGGRFVPLSSEGLEAYPELREAVLTLFFTSLSAQRVQVDDTGVTSHGALGSRSIAWDELEHARLREQRNPFAFTVLDFRRLQRVLDLTAAERSITINEPASRARKARILAVLRQYAPAAKAPLLEGLETW